MKKKTQWPPNVNVSGNNIYYRPRIPPKKRHLVQTTKTGHIKAIFLGTINDPRVTILNRYRKSRDQLLIILESDEGYGTVGWLYRKYKMSEEWCKLSPTSQISYEGRLNRLVNFPLQREDGSEATVGDIPLSWLTRPKVKKLHAKILKSFTDRGLKGINEVNGEFRQLKAMISWALDTYENLEIKNNPCFGFRMPSAPVPDRYVTDDDYRAQLEYVCAKGWNWLAIFFELSYLLASRSVEVRYLKLDGISNLGITVERRKGSHTNIILWSERLRRAYYTALRLKLSYLKGDSISQECEHGCDGFCDHLKEKISSLNNEHQTYLLTNRVGRIRKEALGSAISRLRSSMKADGLLDIYWTPHDLKRKGISDAETTEIAGHKTYEMQQRYNTKIKTYKPPK